MKSISNASAASIASKSTINQQLILDWQGYILESTDTIFDTRQLHYRPVEEWSYFFGSMMPMLHTLELDSPEIFFPRIMSVTNFLTGCYDCSFMRVEWGDNNRVLVWNIFDFSDKLPEMQAQQQMNNEILLKKSY
jgi:hypothetical protein